MNSHVKCNPAYALKQNVCAFIYTCNFKLRLFFFWFYMHSNKFGMLETPGFSEDVQEMGRNPLSVD